MGLVETWDNVAEEHKALGRREGRLLQGGSRVALEAETAFIPTTASDLAPAPSSESGTRCQRSYAGVRPPGADPRRAASTGCHRHCYCETASAAAIASRCQRHCCRTACLGAGHQGMRMLPTFSASPPDRRRGRGSPSRRRCPAQTEQMATYLARVGKLLLN